MSNNTIRNSLYSRKKGSKGIFKSDTGITNFWKYYYQTKKPIPYSKAQLLIKDLFKGYLNILKESDHFYIPTLGYFGITIGEKSKRGGKHVDWIKTYELWKDQWPNLSAEEYTQIKEKPLVFFRNKIGIGKNLMVMWWKMRKKQRYYMFEPTTLFKKELGRLANSSEEFTFPTVRDFGVKLGAVQDETTEIKRNRNAKR